MGNRIYVMLACSAGLGLMVSSAIAAGTGLPGDHGRPNDGIMPLNQPALNGARPPIARPAIPPAPKIKFAVEAAESIATVCKQFSLGVSIVNADGGPILIYIPNGTNPSHGYMALRKAITAVTFKAPTSALVSKAQHDPAFAAQIKANPNMFGIARTVSISPRAINPARK